jgi:HSP20 family protein
MNDVASQSHQNSRKASQTGASLARSAPVPAPWRPFEMLRSEIDRMFEDFGRDWRSPFGMLSRDMGRGLVEMQPPAVDITETPDGFELSAELPGMNEKNVELKLTAGRLVIRGEKKDEREEKTGETYLRERRFGSFERMFTLPEDVDASCIEARFDNGILKVSLPRKPEAKRLEKKIEIKAS